MTDREVRYSSRKPVLPDESGADIPGQPIQKEANLTVNDAGLCIVVVPKL